MKKGLRPVFAFLIMFVMILVSLGWGAQKAWSVKRASVQEEYGTFDTVLSARIENAYNLLTVANRRLPSGSDSVTAVAKDRDTLEGDGSAREKAAANDSLTADAAALLGELILLDDVLKDKQRDLQYVTDLLPAAFRESQAYVKRYNTAAQEFNDELSESFSGWLSRLFGVDYMPVLSADDT